MDLETYLAIKKSPPGAEGKESSWLDVAIVELATGKLGIADPHAFPLGCVLVVLRPDRYELQARVGHRGDVKSLTRLRVVRGGVAGGRGVEMGRVPVGSGVAGFFDYDLVGTATDALDEASLAGVLAKMQAGVPLTLDAATNAVVHPVATGQGEFLVHELLQGDRRVGAELVIGPP